MNEINEIRITFMMWNYLPPCLPREVSIINPAYLLQSPEDNTSLPTHTYSSCSIFGCPFCSIGFSYQFVWHGYRLLFIKKLCNKDTISGRWNERDDPFQNVSRTPEEHDKRKLVSSSYTENVVQEMKRK